MSESENRGDIVGQNKHVQGDEIHGDKVGGDKVNVSDIYNTGIFNLNIKSTLDNVTSTIGALPQDNDSAKAELQQLVTQLNEALQKAPPEKSEEAEAVAAMTKSLVDNVSTDKPNKTVIKINSESLKQAAQNIADVLPTVLSIVTKIVTTIAKFAA